LLDDYLVDVEITLDSVETLCKLQRETNLMLLESCRSLGINPPPTPLTDAGYTPGPATIALREYIEVLKKGSIKADDRNGEDAGEKEDDDAEEDEGDEENMGYEGESEDEDDDSSDSDVPSSDASEATDDSHNPSTSPGTGLPRSFPGLLASSGTESFAEQYAQMEQYAMSDEFAEEYARMMRYAMSDEFAEEYARLMQYAMSDEFAEEYARMMQYAMSDEFAEEYARMY
jgi:hypothetical protein